MSEQFEPPEPQNPVPAIPANQHAGDAEPSGSPVGATSGADTVLESSREQDAVKHGWLGTETLNTRVGSFAFRDGYPTPEAAQQLHELLTINRAVEVFLTQLPAVAVIELRRGMRAFGAERAHQIIIWDSLMDSATLLLTANTETVYAMGFLDLKRDGPTVLEAPPKMLGLAMDTRQHFLVDIGPLGPDKGAGGKYLFLPP